jgi:membrane protease subunit HflK
MPWDNNTGGGGRNTGGPWGQAPQGGGGGGPRRTGGGGNTPSLEDILARGRDQFKGGIPGGRWAFLGVIALLVVFWLFNSIYTIETGQLGVKLRFGKPLETNAPGLHFLIWPIEGVERVAIGENRTTVGSIATGRNANDDGLMLSGDQNIVDVSFSVLWQVTNPEQNLFNVREPDDMVRSVAESAMREVVGRRPAQDIFRDDQAGIANEVQDISQAILDDYGVGVSVNAVTIEVAAPPAEVADAFDEVQRAEQDEDRFQEEARGDANTLLGAARGQAAQLREDAAAYKSRVVQEAQGEAARFISVFDEYIKSPEVTRKRLFLETMEEVLGGSEKVIIESGTGGSGVVPYLPLPALRGSNASATDASR